MKGQFCAHFCAQCAMLVMGLLTPCMGLLDADGCSKETRLDQRPKAPA
jgi:hypothetical protein